MNLMLDDHDDVYSTEESKIRQIVNQIVDFIVDRTCQLEIKEKEEQTKEEISTDEHEEIKKFEEPLKVEIITTEHEENSLPHNELELVDSEVKIEVDSGNLVFQENQSKQEVIADYGLNEDQLVGKEIINF